MIESMMGAPEASARVEGVGGPRGDSWQWVAPPGVAAPSKAHIGLRDTLAEGVLEAVVAEGVG